MTVVRVPYFEFDRVPFWASMVSHIITNDSLWIPSVFLTCIVVYSYSKERQRFLQQLLKAHANIRFSDIDRSKYSVPIPNRKTTASKRFVLWTCQVVAMIPLRLSATGYTFEQTFAHTCITRNALSPVAHGTASHSTGKKDLRPRGRGIV